MPLEDPDEPDDLLPDDPEEPDDLLPDGELDGRGDTDGLMECEGEEDFMLGAWCGVIGATGATVREPPGEERSMVGRSRDGCARGSTALAGGCWSAGPRRSRSTELRGMLRGRMAGWRGWMLSPASGNRMGD